MTPLERAVLYNEITAAWYQAGIPLLLLALIGSWWAEPARRSFATAVVGSVALVSTVGFFRLCGRHHEMMAAMMVDGHIVPGADMLFNDFLMSLTTSVAGVLAYGWVAHHIWTTHVGGSPTTGAVR